MLLYLAMAGCGNGTDLALVEEGTLVAVFPPDGALRVWGDVPVQLVLGSDANLESVQVTVARTVDGQPASEVPEVPLPCGVESGGALVTCGLIPAVEAGEELVLDVRVSGKRHRIRTEARLPEPGLGWSLLDGVEITQLGAGSSAAGLASDQLARGKMFAALDGYDGTAGNWTFVITPSGVAEDGNAAVSPWGFGFLLPVTVAQDGRMWGRADSAWLSTQIGANSVALLLLDVRMEAQLVGDDLVDLSLEAAAPGMALEALATALGTFSAFMELVKLDIDRDSDGELDAATIRLEGAPAPAVLRAWE